MTEVMREEVRKNVQVFKPSLNFIVVTEEEQRAVIVNNYQSMVRLSEYWVTVEGISNKFLREAADWLSLFNKLTETA